MTEIRKVKTPSKRIKTVATYLEIMIVSVIFSVCIERPTCCRDGHGSSSVHCPSAGASGMSALATAGLDAPGCL